MHIPVNDQIHLTDFRATDKVACVQHLGDREIYDQTLRIPFPYSETDFDNWLEIVARAMRRHGEPIHFAVRTSDEELIGGCGFDGLTKGHRAEIGYWLAKPYWGQGIMTSVVGKACEHAFARWKLVRITAHIFHFNRASARVLEKNNFIFEGDLRKLYLKDGQFMDGKLYALVR
ncbi:MAG: GNAT family protein [Thermoguttaceae bacterium]|jgi:RimJ/RimL family protein N-acetyltransferase|nr:GNAT family protein [Thermoguttaceae bacterium]